MPPHAVLKMIIDVLLRAETAALLYTNDTRVLLDISLRRLADLPPGDQVCFVEIFFIFQIVALNKTSLDYLFVILFVTRDAGFTWKCVGLFSGTHHILNMNIAEKICSSVSLVYFVKKQKSVIQTRCWLEKFQMNSQAISNANTCGFLIFKNTYIQTDGLNRLNSGSKVSNI